VLHDLIMRRPLFEEFATPYARLVNAVQSATPEIQSADIPHYLVETARCCLLKDWRKRLRLVTWESFEIKVEASDQHSSAKQRVSSSDRSRNSGELYWRVPTNGKAPSASVRLDPEIGRRTPRSRSTNLVRS
jgi:hypothetical protein